MAITKSEIRKLEILAIKDSAEAGAVKMVILPHSTQVGLKYDPEPLLVTGPFYAESRSQFAGPVKYKQAVTMLTDLTVSGTLYAERIVVEVDESVTGSLWVSGSLLVSQSAAIRKGLEVNTSKGSESGTGGDDFIVFGAAPGNEIISALASSDQVLFLSAGPNQDEKDYADMAFFVSGSVGSRGTTVKGTAIFGGDTVVSGALYLDERAEPAGNIPDGTVALYGKEASGVTKLYFKNESGETEVGSGGGSTNPGGNDTQIQYNDGGSAFGGIVDLTWNDTDLTVGGQSSTTKLQFRDSGLYINSPADGDLHIDSDGRVLIMSGGGVTSYDEASGADVSFYVSGSTPSIDLGLGGVALFGGDVAISGSLIVHGDNTNTPYGTISGSIHETSDGLSYLVAGSSVTIVSASNGQVTIASTGAASDSFKTIAVSGQSDVIADSSTDTLTLVGGSNITITTDAANDTITFAAAGGGGGSGDYQAKNANFTAGTSEYMFGIDSSQGHLTGTLPAAASAGSGKQYIFKDSSGYAGNTSKGIHIATDSNSEKIDNADAANILVNSGSITVMTDGNDWFVIGVS